MGVTPASMTMMVKINFSKKGKWNRSTELCVDLKTILRSDPVMKTGKAYHGTLRLNFRPLKTDGHFSVNGYAFKVYLELLKALLGLVEERNKK